MMKRCQNVLFNFYIAIKQNIDFKDPSKFIKHIEVRESLKNISTTDDYVLADIYIEF